MVLHPSPSPRFGASRNCDAGRRYYYKFTGPSLEVEAAYFAPDLLYPGKTGAVILSPFKVAPPAWRSTKRCPDETGCRTRQKLTGAKLRRLRNSTAIYGEFPLFFRYSIIRASSAREITDAALGAERANTETTGSWPRELTKADRFDISATPPWFLVCGGIRTPPSTFSIAHLPSEKITNAARWKIPK